MGKVIIWENHAPFPSGLKSKSISAKNKKPRYLVRYGAFELKRI